MVSQSVSNLGIFLDCRLVGCFMVHGQSAVISRLDLLTSFIDCSTVVVEIDGHSVDQSVGSGLLVVPYL